MSRHLPKAIEICVENTDGLVAAQNAGADRAELCASLVEGGLTPSYGMVREAQRVAKIPFFVMVRPRGGDFLYSEIEFNSMLEDVKAFREMGVEGVVAGCLTADGRIDVARMKAIVDAARPMKVTCHRAFDMTRDHVEAIEGLVAAGVDRVLTSGRHETGVEGIEVLKETVEAAKGRIVIMGCGALDASNIATVLDATHVDEVHFAALVWEKSPMQFRNPTVGMGGTELDREYSNQVTSEPLVRQVIAAARAA